MKGEKKERKPSKSMRRVATGVIYDGGDKEEQALRAGGDFLCSLFLLLSPSHILFLLLHFIAFLSSPSFNKPGDGEKREQTARTKEDIFISCQH